MKISQTLVIAMTLVAPLSMETAVADDDRGGFLSLIVEAARHDYNAPSHYSNSGAYYPYAPPPPSGDRSSRNRHAYDVGFRVGQDDFHNHMSKSYSRHHDLFDKDTQDSFAKSYRTGYDRAKDEASSHRRPYVPPRASNTHVKSDHYPSGYYPYSPPPRGAKPEERNRHAYEVGYRIGQDDFNHGRSKHFTRHENMYDSNTHHSFGLGYDHGYDKARDHSRPAGGELRVVKGQGLVTVYRGDERISVIRSAAPDVEKLYLVSEDHQIVVKSRGRHGPAVVELFDIQTGTLRDKVMAYAITNGRPAWARGMED